MVPLVTEVTQQHLCFPVSVVTHLTGQMLVWPGQAGQLAQIALEVTRGYVDNVLLDFGATSSPQPQYAVGLDPHDLQNVTSVTQFKVTFEGVFACLEVH